MNTKHRSIAPERRGHNERSCGGTSAYAGRKELHALLNVSEFEELLRSIPGTGEGLPTWKQHSSATGLNNPAACESGFWLPVTISRQTLLDDLSSILAIFVKDRLSTDDWAALEAGFFDLLFTKYSVYCKRMAYMGKADEAMQTKWEMLRIISDAIKTTV